MPRRSSARKVRRRSSSSVSSALRPTGTSRFGLSAPTADLELLFVQPDGRRRRVWFEVKVDSPAYRAQGQKYMDRLDELSDAWEFSWLLRVGEGVDGGPPDGARITTWQDVAATLNEWAGEQPDESAFGIGLAREFIRFLEEEQLARIDPLTTADARALNGYEAALPAWSGLVKGTLAELSSRWGELDEPEENFGRRSNPLWFWRHYPKHGPGRPLRWREERCWFEFHARRDDARIPTEQRGEVVFGAGVLFEVAHAPRTNDHADWLDLLFARGFEYGNPGPKHPYHYLFRYKRLDELDGVADLAAQAYALATWVIETWEQLENEPFSPDEPPSPTV